jgi:DNA-binding NarL/FixJ family response regulator
MIILSCVRGIAALLKTQPDMELVAEASDGEEAIAQFRRHRPDATLMDLQMPNVNGTEAISRIRSEFPNAKILVLSTYAGDVHVLRAIKAGARGYLVKGNVRTELLEAIRTVHADASESRAKLRRSWPTTLPMIS